MVKEIFGPVITIYIYNDLEDWEKILNKKGFTMIKCDKKMMFLNS